MILVTLALTGLACQTLAPGGPLFGRAAPTAAPTASPTAAATPDPTPTAQLLPTHVSARPSGGPGRERAPSSASSLFDDQLPGRTLAAETEHFTFYAGADGYLPVDLERWKAEAEAVYDYVAARVQAQSGEKIALAFLPPQRQACPIRGLAAQGDPPQVIIFAGEDSPEAYLMAVLAHELGHAIPSEGFAGGLPNDLALTEGLATWASGKYWAAWKGVDSLDALVAGYVKQGTYIPLNEAVEMPAVYPWQEGAGEDCLERRDQVYSQWGSFVGYVIDTYGWETAHALFESARSEVQGDLNVDFPTDYPAVLGLALNQVEAEWLRSIVGDGAAPGG